MKKLISISGLVSLGILLSITYTNFTYSTAGVPWDIRTSIRLSSLIRAGQPDVVIPVGVVAYVDENINIGTLTINGQLHCPEDLEFKAEVRASTINVNGILQCGTVEKPVLGKVIFSLKPNASVSYFEEPNRGLIVRGALVLAGHKRGAYWGRLTSPAPTGATQIKVPLRISEKWRVDDEIVIGGTGFSGIQSERRTISGFSEGKTVVHFNQPLLYNHWAGSENYVLNDKTYTLNESAEVANLTRQIVVRADRSDLISEGPENGSQIGGHIMVMGGGAAYVDAVELDHMGQAGVLARYPFHWHVAGDVQGQYIRNSSIHDSYQRCVTIHATNQATVVNNICYKFKGHGFFLENGSERLNVIKKNLAMYSMAPTRSKILLASDNPYQSEGTTGTSKERFPAVANFWISHPDNTVEYNVASGGVGTGFWMSYEPFVRQFRKESGRFDGPIIDYPANANLRSWKKNIAHSLMVGHTWDGVRSEIQAVNPNDDDAVAKGPNPNNINDMKLMTNYFQPQNIPVIDGLEAFKIRRTGMYFRGFTAIFTNSIYADNYISYFVAKNQILKDSVIVARSQNEEAEVEGNAIPNLAGFQRTGAVIYDGPFELDNVGFFRFDTKARFFGDKNVTSTPFGLTGGANRHTNIVRRLIFDPQPLYRAYDEPDTYEKQNDHSISSKVRALDNSLTGRAGDSLLPASVASPECIQDNRFVGYKVCPAGVNDAVLQMDISNQAVYVPFVLKRNSDDILSLPQNVWNILIPMNSSMVGGTNSKVRVLTSGNYDYDLAVLPSSGLRVKMNSEYPDTMSPVINLKQYGRNCSLVDLAGTQMPQVTSIDALKSATDVAYYSSENSFSFRLKTHQPIVSLVAHNSAYTQESISRSVYQVRCQPLDTSVIGYIGRVSTNGSTTEVLGWACRPSLPGQLSVVLSANAPSGQAGAITVARSIANLDSEPDVNFACGNIYQQGYRFKFTFTMPSSLKGRPLYVTASLDGNMAILNGSGRMLFP